MHAWERVSSNAGARTPGVDRATVARIEAQVGVVAFLERHPGVVEVGRVPAGRGAAGDDPQRVIGETEKAWVSPLSPTGSFKLH